MREVVFYCGAHKTASSMIRKFLRKNENFLEAKCDIKSYDREVIINSDFFNVISKLSSYQEVQNSEWNKGRDSFLSFMDAGNYSKYLFHNEDFFTAMFFNNVGAISRYLSWVAEGMNTKVIIYVRNQVDYIESWYLQKIHTGNIVSFDKYLSRINLNGFSWTKVLDAIASNFGRENVNCIPYESIQHGSKEYLQNFISLLTDKNIDISNYDTEGQNRSFSGIAVDMAVNFYPRLNRKEQKILRKFLQENFSTRTHEKPILFLPEERDNIKKIYSKDNKILFKKYISGYVQESNFYF
ncbi:hypothetical protein Nhal_0386 [Nitrosococcus halophilus Nc 4]|uniref:Sulfotransferase domain-containing protein n=1 Tax=Nitrosococcus halophilus (strain Nc4) TaxID=472759 RepID=D5BVF0_NITHN|nr:hypothetical protein [Nitrosococcus halophilus]ADE13578.1 hypothetical protein Nhal_0386 [Nitrosococcus halophilus Nc 4]